MENISHLLLSDYQRAILNEMGISSWQLADQDKTKNQVENQTREVAAVPSEVISKEDALAKLKQLKVKTQTTELTHFVLVTFSLKDTQCQIFTDILMALGLEAKQQKHISTEQLDHYSGYPLSWTQGEKVSFKRNQLITPAFGELHHSEIKKQLWQQLQSVLPLVEN